VFKPKLRKQIINAATIKSPCSSRSRQRPLSSIRHSACSALDAKSRVRDRGRVRHLVDTAPRIFSELHEGVLAGLDPISSVTVDRVARDVGLAISKDIDPISAVAADVVADNPRWNCC